MSVSSPKVLVVDIGGTNVKTLLTGQRTPARFPSGPTLTAHEMASGVRRLVRDGTYDAVSIGYPGPVRRDRPAAEPYNLGRGWVDFDYTAAFGRPVKVINDAAMQALGAYRGGKMLFLGFGTGMGSAVIIQGVIEPLELGHLPYRRGVYEDYVGRRGLERLGKRKWRKRVREVILLFIAALQPDDVVVGGGNVKKLKDLPEGCRWGSNADAFIGGFRLWAPARAQKRAGLRLR
jgi:polyphosphate glucokinase